MSISVSVQEVVQIHSTDVHEDDLSDGIDTLRGGDDMGSGTDEDDSDGDIQEEPFVPSPPSEDDIERRIHDEFTQWNHRTRQCTDLQDQDCHFIPWSGVGHCLPYNPRPAKVVKEVILKRIRPETKQVEFVVQLCEDSHDHIIGRITVVLGAV